MTGPRLPIRRCLVFALHTPAPNHSNHQYHCFILMPYPIPDVFLYLLCTAYQDEYGTVAYKTVELDCFLDDKAVQHREVQGHESDLLLSYFPNGIRYVALGRRKLHCGGMKLYLQRMCMWEARLKIEHHVHVEHVSWQILPLGSEARSHSLLSFQCWLYPLV